jgi:DNA-binding transcriptional ArsR family regulator
MPAELDGRTRAILDALAWPGADLLYALLLTDGATEGELIVVTGASQATANRRLARLEELGIVERPRPRQSRTPNRRWRLRHPETVRRMLVNAVDLAERGAHEEASARRHLLDRLRPVGGSLRELRR